MTDSSLDLEARVSAAMAVWAAAMRDLLVETDSIARGRPVDHARMDRLSAAVDFAKHAYEQAKAERDRML